MSELDLTTVPAAPPMLNDDGEPIPCPRCGGVYERPLPGIPGHPTGHPRLCIPLAPGPHDSRERKAARRLR